MDAGRALIDDLSALAPRVPVEPGSHLAAFLEVFAPLLSRGAELSCAPGYEGVEVTVSGPAPAFQEDVPRYLAAAGFEPDQYAALPAIWRYFPGVGALLKVKFGPAQAGSPPSQTPACSIYFQHPVDLRLAATVSRLLGTGRLPLDRILDLGLLLQRKTCFVGVELGQGRPPLLSLYFPHLYRKVRETFLPGAAAVMGKLDFAAVQINRFLALHALVARHLSRSVFTSLAYRDGLLNLIKFDYDTVPLEVVGAVARLLGVSGEWYSGLKRVAARFEVESVTYLGLKFQGQEQKLKCYFNRYYGDTAGLGATDLATYLEDSRWLV